MSTTVIYRLNGGEVIKISHRGQQWPERDTNYWGVLTDPQFVDGETNMDPDGNRRVLGYAKIVDASIVRNATQAEIDEFPSKETEDTNKQDSNHARSLFIDHPRWRKVFIAFSDILLHEINILRNKHDLPPRTLAQLKAAIMDRINKDD